MLIIPPCLRINSLAHGEGISTFMVFTTFLKYLTYYRPAAMAAALAPQQHITVAVAMV